MNTEISLLTVPSFDGISLWSLLWPFIWNFIPFFVVFFVISCLYHIFCYGAYQFFFCFKKNIKYEFFVCKPLASNLRLAKFKIEINIKLDFFEKPKKKRNTVRKIM